MRKRVSIRADLSPRGKRGGQAASRRFKPDLPHYRFSGFPSGRGNKVRAGKAIGRAVGAAQLGCLVLAMVVVLIPADPSRLLVLARRVVRPAPVGAALVAAAVVLAILARVVAPALPPAGAPGAVAVAGRTRRCCRTGAAGSLGVPPGAGRVRATAALGDANSRYLVVGPASPSECRVVVDQRSFLLLGSGVVHGLRPGEHLTHAVGGYVADDGYRPFDVGTCRLTWSGETAMLELWGDPNMPVSPAHQRLPCS